MATSPIIFSILFLSIFSLSSLAQPSFRPKGLILPITKDQTTLQYTTTINQRTPLIPTSLVFDLGGRNLWTDCDKNYISSTYTSPRCRSSTCSLAGSNGCSSCFQPQRPGCNNNTCGGTPDNTVTRTATAGEIATDVISIQSTNGFNPTRAVQIPNLVFVCGATFLLEGLAKGTVGMAGFGRHPTGLPSQFATAFSFNRKFAVCLTSGGKGVAFYGNVPYTFRPGIPITDLTTTPLLINPVSTASAFPLGEKSSEYFIGVTAIKIDEKNVPLNASLLKIDGTTGVGGTKISTVNPYTVLERSMFNAFTSAFVKEAAARNITRVAFVKPFGACFSTKNVPVTRVGYAVPEIQLVLQGNVVWRITGSNSMVSVSEDVMCLGFVDGGVNARTSVVIGGFQLEDNLVEFDLAGNRFGFSETLLGRRTTCANFNFTSTA